MMHTLRLTLPVLIVLTVSVATAQPTTDSLIEHSLSMVDYRPFVQQGPAPPLSPRLGIYMQDFPADSVRAITRGVDTIKGSRIWHVTPHWSADKAGLMLGDVVIRVNGRTLLDSVYGPDDVLNTRVREHKVGDVLRFEVIRDRAMREIQVPLLAGTRTSMSYQEPAALGPLRQSWLERTLVDHAQLAWADTIAKQIRNIADMVFCDLPFTERANPFRLNAITYLAHYPLRVGALSRAIDQAVWDSIDHGHGLSGAIAAAAQELGAGPAPLPRPSLPQTREELTLYFEQVQRLIDRAYAPVGNRLDSIAIGLSQLLNADTSWESEVDTTQDPVKQLQARSRAELMLTGLLGPADKVEMRALSAAGQWLAALADTNWLRTFAKQFNTSMPAKKSARKPGIDVEWNTPYGRCVIGSAGSASYTEDAIFILDLGGNDAYELPAVKPGRFRFIADLGGDDVHRGVQSTGSGVGSVDVVVDLEGDDVYRASRWSQGAGCLGIGVLADLSGNDVYTSEWCSQGAGMLGIGVLYDHAGADQYSVDVYAQGFAYMKGFGMLLERSGNDAFRAGWKHPDSRWPNRAHLSMSQGFGYGMRPWSTGVGTDGGIGLLSDVQGDDTYTSDYFSQGGSYWYALGILHDRQGADRYSAGQYSQGSGIHLSFAALLDDAGDDSYDGYAWLEQGNAHDWSSGCLEDFSGNDTYRASGASQGCGFFVSFGYLLDSKGDDRYYLKQSDTTNSQGGGNFIPPRRSGSLGVLMDLGKGLDEYTDTRIKPGEVAIKSERGVGYDDGRP